MLLQRRRVAVVELHAVGAGRELVGVTPAWLDDLEDAVHVRRVDAVEVDGVRVRARVHERHAQAGRPRSPGSPAPAPCRCRSSRRRTRPWRPRSAGRRPRACIRVRDPACVRAPSADTGARRARLGRRVRGPRPRSWPHDPSMVPSPCRRARPPKRPPLPRGPASRGEPPLEPAPPLRAAAAASPVVF